jgi:hypothetical protein
VAAFLNPMQLSAGTIDGITANLYTRYPLFSGETSTDFYRPNITTLYVGQSIDVWMKVYNPYAYGSNNVLNFYIDGNDLVATDLTWSEPYYYATMLNYTAVAPGVQKLYAHIKDDWSGWQNYDELDITVLQGPAPAASISVDKSALTLGQTATISANFTLPGGDSGVGSNIDLGAVGTPAPGQDGSAQTSRTYTFTPTTTGTYKFYADIKTGHQGWTNYSLYYHDYADSTGDHYWTGLTYVTVTVTPVPPPPSAPVFNVNPASVTIASGATANFTANATGNPTPNSYQWQYSTVGNTGPWSNVGSSFKVTTNAYGSSPATTLTVSGLPSAAGPMWFQCIASNSQGSKTSPAAQLTITPGPFDATVPALPLWALAGLIGIVFFVVKATLLKPSRA